MEVHQRRSSQRLRIVPKIVPPRKKWPVFLTSSSSPSSDDDEGFGMTGPTATSSRTRFQRVESASSSSKTSTRLNSPPKESLPHPASPPFIQADALLRTLPSFHILSLNSISSPLLVGMQEQSPPPYTPPEFDLDDNSYYPLPPQLQPVASSFPSSAASSIDTSHGDRRDDEREGKVICTTPDGICAGETETETDEPSPTAITPHSKSSPFPPSTLQQLRQKLIPLLFEFSRLLSIVPAFFGTVWNLYWLIWPPNGTDTLSDSGGWGGRKTPPERADFFVAALWSILTGYQCLALTTGLLTRWQTYYPPLATVIRLLALQGICWPATQLTLTVLDHARRPVVCWCVVGTTTCFSRSVQIWVTSNISIYLSGEESAGCWKGTNPNLDGSHTVNGRPGPDASTPSAETPVSHRIHRPLTQRRPRFRWVSTKRRWDWTEVSLKCVLPAGVLYFVMAWVGELRREWAGC